MTIWNPSEEYPAAVAESTSWTPTRQMTANAGVAARQAHRTGYGAHAGPTVRGLVRPSNRFILQVNPSSVTITGVEDQLLVRGRFSGFGDRGPISASWYSPAVVGNAGALTVASDGTFEEVLTLVGGSRDALTITGKDRDGRTASAVIPLLVSENLGPTADLVLSDLTANTITVSAAGSTAGSTPIATYTYSWGDGTDDTVSASSTAEHTYASIGTYAVSVTVTDESLLNDTASITGGVSIAVIGPTANLVVTQEPVELKAFTRASKRASLTDGRSTMTAWDIRTTSSGYAYVYFLLHVNEGDVLSASVGWVKVGGSAGPGGGSDNKAFLFEYHDEFIDPTDAAFINSTDLRLGLTPDYEEEDNAGNVSNAGHNFSRVAGAAGTIALAASDGWSGAAMQFYIVSLTLNGSPVFTTSEGNVDEDAGGGAKPAYAYSALDRGAWRIKADASGSVAGTDPIDDYEFDFGGGDVVNQATDDPVYRSYDSGGEKSCTLTVTADVLTDEATESVEV